MIPERRRVLGAPPYTSRRLARSRDITDRQGRGARPRPGFALGGDDYVTNPFKPMSCFGAASVRCLTRTRPGAPGPRLRVAGLDSTRTAHEVADGAHRADSHRVPAAAVTDGDGRPCGVSKCRSCTMSGPRSVPRRHRGRRRPSYLRGVMSTWAAEADPHHTSAVSVRCCDPAPWEPAFDCEPVAAPVLAKPPPVLGNLCCESPCCETRGSASLRTQGDAVAALLSPLPGGYEWRGKLSLMFTSVCSWYPAAAHLPAFQIGCRAFCDFEKTASRSERQQLQPGGGDRPQTLPTQFLVELIAATGRSHGRGAAGAAEGPRLPAAPLNYGRGPPFNHASKPLM